LSVFRDYLNSLLHIGQLIVTANVVPSSLILFTMMMEATGSSETSVLTRITPQHTLEDDIFIAVVC
jgi:hypothetical protein